MRRDIGLSTAAALVAMSILVAAYSLSQRRREKNAREGRERKEDRMSERLSAPNRPLGETHKAMTLSAPGKVLLVGGYLILEPEHEGLVLAASARFYTTIALTQLEDAAESMEATLALPVRVVSPQFHQQWTYHLCRGEHSLFRLEPRRGQEENTYVEMTLLYCFTFLSVFMGPEEFCEHLLSLQNKGKQLDIILRADNDFYSQRRALEEKGLPLNSQGLKELPRFNPCVRDSNGIVQINKTGMGSSAALITSLVAAVLSFFGAVQLSISSDEERSQALDIVHNLAQISHGAAQGKVGSGFDVSAAVYGSQRYRRFRPQAIEKLLSIASLSPAALHEAVLDTKREWQGERAKFSLPPGLHLLMGDVQGGSETMPQEYTETLERCATLEPQEWVKGEKAFTGAVLYSVRKAFLQIRSQLKAMGEAAGVDVEPDSQTLLADRTMAIPGVLAAGVPGAGGVDAIFAIVLNETVRAKVERLWEQWSRLEGTSVCPLSLTVAPCGADGLRHEPSSSYPWTSS